MPKIIYRYGDGTERRVDATPGVSVMRTALAAGIGGIVAECGGNAMCATCHVYVDPERLGELPPMQDDEDEMLDCAFSDREPNSRLSCQITVTAELDGLVVEIPPAQTS
jgi:ferredoxin, 2Fe-2S